MKFTSIIAFFVASVTDNSSVEAGAVADMMDADAVMNMTNVVIKMAMLNVNGADSEAYDLMT